MPVMGHACALLRAHITDEAMGWEGIVVWGEVVGAASIEFD